jgi:hypothetical protein
MGRIDERGVILTAVIIPLTRKGKKRRPTVEKSIHIYFE